MFANIARSSTIEKSFRSSLIILFFSELTSTIGPLVDGIVISAFFGAEGVAEFGIINPMLIAYNALGSVFAVGSVALCTRLVGKGRTKEARGAFSVAFWWILGLSVLFTAVLLALAGPVTGMLGAPYGISPYFEDARNYFIGITVSFPAINLMLYLTSYMQVDNDRSRALAATIVLTVTDIAGDLLVATVLKGGMLGMGLATSAANYLALIVLLLHFKNKTCFFRPAIRKLPWKMTGNMLRDGSAAFVTLVGNTLMFILLNRILTGNAGSQIMLVAFTAQRNVFNILSAVCKSVGRTTMSMAGFFYGERSESDLKELFRLIVKYTVLMAGGVAVLAVLIAPVFALLFTGGSREAVPEAASAIRIIALCLPFITFNIGYECIFRGGGRLAISIVLTLLRDFLLTVLAGIVLTPVMGPKAVYWAITISQIVLTAGILAVICLRCRRKDQSRTAMVLFLPRGFDVPQEDRISREIRTVSECVELSESVRVFCAEHGLDQRRCLSAALCLEEMCRNILEHGFTGKGSLISVRVIYDEDRKIHLSIRDNCRAFSPIEWEKLHHDPADPMSNIGIHLVCEMSKEMRYVNLLNMNSLYITI